MDYFKQISEVNEKELFPGFLARLVHTDGLTIAHLRVESGSELPEHKHPHEQVTNIISGELEMTVGGKTYVCGPGTVITIPGEVKHSARALNEVTLIDIFRPVREDYR